MFATLQTAAQNRWENWLTQCEYAADFLFFSSPQSWFLWQGLSESTAKVVSWKFEFWKANTSPLIMNRLLTLKRSFYLANTIQNTTTEPENPPLRSKRTPNPTQFEQEHLSPFMQEASMRFSGQTQNAWRRNSKMSLTHHKMSERKYNVVT